MLDWLSHPVAMYGFIAISAGLNAWLFLSLKVDGASAAAAAERRERTLQATIDDLRQRIARLELEAERDRKIAEMSASAGAAVAELPGGDLNLTRRSQALRLARRGEKPEKIAAALGIPLHEVDLLLKVQEIITGALQQ